MLESTEKGGVRNSIRNCLTVFQNDPLLSGAIAKNLLTERVDIVKPIGYHRIGTAITDTDMNYLLLYLEETYGLTSEKKITAAIGIVANENGYHPVRDYLNGLSWDGQERIRYCLRHFLGADTDQYTYEALRLFLLGAIHRAFHPGCKFEVMLCLVGGQGAGKSTFFRLLADGAVSPGTPKAEKDETLRWPVALIQREEHDGTRRYYIEEQEVRIVSGTTGKDGSFVPGEKEELRFPREDFGDAAELVLHLLKNVSGEEVEVTEGLEAFLDAVNIFDLEAKTEDRTDFSVAFWHPGKSEAGAKRCQVCRAHGEQGECPAGISYGSGRTHDDD